VLLALSAALWLTSTAVRGQTESRDLWRIGQADSSTKDLALGPRDFEKFSADPVFVIGRSKARESWPYVQPGPDDAWAGGRSHVFTVLFNIAELPRSLEGSVVLRLLLYDTHSENPPKVSVTFNGEARQAQTEPGAGDASIVRGGPGRAGQLSFEFPAGRLQQGRNKIEIRSVQGSWFLYDAVQFLAPAGVRLGPAPPFYQIERVEDTVLRRRGARAATQIVRVQVLASADQPLSATLSTTVEVLGVRQTVSEATTVRPGRQVLDLDIPRLSGWPAKVTVILTVAGEQYSTGGVTVRSHRAWTVYLVPHSHVDIGYTDVQTQVLELQKKSIGDVMDFVEGHPEFTGDARFCWNVEVLWAVKDFLSQADEAQRARFVRHVRDGSIGLEALFANELTGLCTSEEMVRLIGYAGRLVRDFGLPIDTAMISDVPGYSWGLAAVLGNAGVKYFDMGPNGGDRIGSVRRVWENRPFYWVAPDGKNRVLTWLPPLNYAGVFDLLQRPEAVARFLAYLRRLDANPDYPYDIVPLRMCAHDNATPPFQLCRIVRDWNERYESPRLIIGRSRDAFVALEKKFGDRIPSYTGDFSPYWEDGAASSADETRRNRQAAKSLEAAEKIWSTAGAAASTRVNLRAAATALDAAWDNVLLYDEHTWGAHNSISEPDSPFVAAQWKIKQGFALDAEQQSEKLVRDALEALARNVPAGSDRAILVFNPCSWERTDVATVELPTAENVAIVDSDNEPLACVRSEDRKKLTFIARAVPPLGYRTYSLVPADCTGNPSIRTAQVDPEKGQLESRFFHVGLDGRGASVKLVVSLARRPISERLISLGDFDRFLYCREGYTTDVIPAVNGAITLARPESPDGAALVIRSKAPGCKSLDQTIELHGELPWMDVTNQINREDIRQPEGLYFDFPFRGLKNAAIRFNTAWAPVRLEEDLLPGACKNWFCVQDWVEISDRRQTVVLSPMDAPLVEIGEIHPNLRGSRLPVIERLWLNPPRVLSFFMNNYWHTNYRASQPGATWFRYRLYRYDGPSDPVKTMRRGIEAREPLRATVVAAGNKGSLPADTHSFARVTPDHVIVTAIAPAERAGTLIRLHEIAGRTARVTLTVPGFGKQAERVNLWEQPQGKLDIRDGEIGFDAGPREIATIRVFGP
jgi:hypothetical protein